MKNMKYIIVMENGLECAIVFDACLSHRDVGNVYQFVIKSAGFCEIHITDGKFDVYCYGKSDSLKVESREEEDVKRVKFWLERMQEGY